MDETPGTGLEIRNSSGRLEAGAPRGGGQSKGYRGVSSFLRSRFPIVNCGAPLVADGCKTILKPCARPSPTRPVLQTDGSHQARFSEPSRSLELQMLLRLARLREYHFLQL